MRWIQSGEMTFASGETDLHWTLGGKLTSHRMTRHYEDKRS